MFMMLKVFGFAVFAVLVTVYVAPAFTESGADESGDVEPFKMKAPKPQPSSFQAVPTLEQIKTLAANGGADDVSLDFSTLEYLAAQNTDDLIAAIKAGAKGDIPEQTEKLVISAVEKARDIVEKDGFL
jgi:hypothetical protein